MKFKLERKNYPEFSGSDLFDIHFGSTMQHGFCGSIFVQHFPHAEDAQKMTMTVSRQRTRRKGVQRYVLDIEGRLPGVIHKGKFVQLTDDSVNYLARKLKLHNGDSVYVTVDVIE